MKTVKLVNAAIITVALTLAACGPGERVDKFSALMVSYDSTNHVACYHWSVRRRGWDDNISCLRIDK